MSDVKSFSFDFNVAKKKLSNDAIVDYLRNTAHTNINWNFFNNQDNNQIVDSLSANSDGIEIYDVGQEALREDMQERAKNLYAQKDTQGEKFLNFFGDMFHTQDSKARKRQEEDLERNLKYLDINALDDEGANTLANALSLQTLDKDTGKLLSAKDSLAQRKNALLQKDEILNTQNYHDLSAEQKKVVDDEVGAVENFFRDYVPFVDNREKNFKEWQQVERNREFVNSELLPKIEALKSETFRIADLLSSDTEKRAKAQGFLDDVAKIAQEFGFDDAGYDKDSNLYIGKDGEFYRVNENFFDNFLNTISATKFELGGSIAGGIYGLKAGKNAGKLGAVGGAIAGAALGAMGGSVADSIVNHYLLDKDAGAKDIIHKSLEAGALSVVGDIALLGLSKIPLKSTIHKATSATNWVVNSNVFTGTAKNYLHGQNIQAAQDLLNASVNAEQQAAIKAFAKEFGGDIKKFDKQRVTPQIEQAFGADSVITKTAQKLDDLLIRNDKGNAQRELLEIIRSDDSSLSLGLLLEVAQESPTANKALRDLLKATTINLEKQLETLNISPQTAFTIFRDLQIGTKESYNQAINEVLNELYQDKRTILNRAPYDKLRADLEQNVLLGQNELNFLKFVENNIFNPQGVTFSQLNNAKKILNSFYKDVQGGTKDYLKNVVEKDLKQQIDNAIFEIFKTEPKLYGEAKNLYENALSDYATMANTIKTLKKIGFDKSTKTQEEALNALIKYAKGGGGIAEIPNYAELTKGLSEANKQSLELSALQQIFTESLIGDESFKVFDSKAFFKKLGNLENVFNTQGAKEYIGFLRGFDKLFHNDAEIALRLGFASPKQEGSSIATSLQGAMQQKFIKGVFATLIRNLPHNSIIIKGLGFSEKVQGAALRYHLRRALEKSKDINDFKYHFSQKATHYPFNNATKEIIKRITNDVLEAINNETRDLLDKTKPLRMAKQEELTDEILREAQTLNAKLWIDNLESKELIESLGMNSTQPAKIIMQGDTITHILARHGAQSPLVQKSGQKAVSNEDLITHSNIIKNADIQGVATNKDGQKVLISGKQINGYCVVVESISTKQNELKLKTMYFENGNLRDNEAIKSIERLLSETPRNPLVQRPNNHLDNTHLTMQGNIIPHSKPFASTKAAGDNEAFTQAIKAFGENYPQFYHKGSEAIEHLLQKRSGQVQGAFYREDLGDITLIWGNEGTGKSDGYGLSKIAKYHPEVLEKLEDLVTNLPIIKETPNRYQLENENYKIAIRKDFEGQNENWILTAFEKKESIARRRTDLPSSQSEAKKTTLANTQGNIIPHSKPFASANFTKEQWQNLTTQEKIQAFREQRAREKAQIAEAQAQADRSLNADSLQTQGMEIKGKGFTAQNPQNVTEPLRAEFDMQEWAKLTSGIKLDAQLRADLEKLATKHPEMFKKPSDVFKLLMKIKNNPTHFLPNNRDDVAMIAKILNDKKIGKMGIKKENGEVVHLTNRDIRPKDAKVNNPLAVEPPTHYHTSIMEQGDGANAHLLKDNLNSTTNTQNLQGNTIPTYKPDTIIDGDVPYPLTQRQNTIPTATQEDIIDVEVIQKYITHTPRNKLREDLSDLTTLYPQLFLDKASVLTNTLRMLNNPKLLVAPKNPEQQIIKETLAQKSGAYKQGSLFDEKDLAEIPQNNAVVKENLTTQNPQDYTTLQKQLFGNSEQLKNTSNMESNTAGKENLRAQDSAQADLKTLRQEAQKALRLQQNKAITNLNDNTQAIINATSIKEMLSAKAIAQSVKNGFTQTQHIKAVENVAELFKNARFIESQEPRHKKPHIKNYRIYESDFEKAKAILSVQERKVGDDIVYFLKL